MEVVGVIMGRKRIQRGVFYKKFARALEIKEGKKSV